MTITTTAPITGAPYMPGDPITVEVEGVWREAVVDGVSLNDSSRFGLRWTLFVIIREEAMEGLDRECPGVWVRCDDNGRNHTWRHQVCPSSRTHEDAHDGYPMGEL